MRRSPILPKSMPTGRADVFHQATDEATLPDFEAPSCPIRFWGRSHTSYQGRDAPTNEALIVAAPGNASRTPPGPTRNTCTAVP